ncbi:MAG: Uncharacterized protein XE11_0138 [Methanomicrobiales archaeon 53_19]|uniref:HdeD family acid-resistance protein n=1 Tax=Methanocalculus sp. TaxID=2004547 RepID=UPI000746C9E9|nr:DUF308 domain-containing protein [Methanocalculus sp.]KUK70476.1 MAG: Uncharacterized protein XD88_0650 [Methanocalculus sp. 52_23]KUL04983.1 MAG: Uncharacterized protein XE11_0138 [Methanomicrobiales archaeon 53_19]HIJ06656.1 hypothetical protein [Methanocalculus sp.]
MQRLEDLLKPLHEGVWEVVVPKSGVASPLSENWVISRMNIPSPGTLASYRFGQYHLHETASEYRVHLDRYDPKEHPVLHLADDAPLVLMVIDTVSALLIDSKKAFVLDTPGLLSEQAKAWKLVAFCGIFMLLFGIRILTEPFITFDGLTRIIIPLLFLALSYPFLRSAFVMRPFRLRSIGRFIIGLGIALLALSSFFSEPDELAGIFLFVLAIWTFASAWISLKRVLKGKKAVPEGFWLRLAVGILSLVVAFMTVIAPDAIIEILMYLLAGIALLIGIYLLAEGMALRKRMRVSNPPGEEIPA